MMYRIIAPFKPTLKYIGKKIKCNHCLEKIWFWSERVEFMDRKTIDDHLIISIYPYHLHCFITRMQWGIDDTLKDIEKQQDTKSSESSS